ncbi:MAG: response regulator [Deltaproteobacteria bacterium]|nr:response regulator [Deltaproteobacteria bacterium]
MEKATVLVVEDELEVAEVLAFNLHHAGYRVRRASDGLTACRLIADAPPDLVLLDILLPDLDGWEICRMIRSHPDATIARLPVIFLSALSQAEHRVRGIRLGADDYVSKPFSVDEVTARVRARIERSHAEQGLRVAVARLEGLRRRQDELQSFLFHELKNKLVVIAGFARRLQQTPEPDAQRRKAYIGAVGSASRYLADLAEEMLLLRRLEKGSEGLPLSPVDLATVGIEALELHGPDATSRRATLCASGSSSVRPARAHPQALRLCVSNLVENALRYGPSANRVTVAWGERPEGVYLEVTDKGPGIPEAEMHRVVQPFERGVGAGDRPGTGLGLYAVKTLVQAMGGRLVLANRAEGGLRARLELRAWTGPKPQSSPPAVK